MYGFNERHGLDKEILQAKKKKKGRQQGAVEKRDELDTGKVCKVGNEMKYNGVVYYNRVNIDGTVTS